MRKFLVIAILPLFLYACASTEEVVASYRSMNERDLCMSYLLAATGNVWQEERYMVISEKNYDCNKYIPEAELRLGKRLIEKIESNY